MRRGIAGGWKASGISDEGKGLSVLFLPPTITKYHRIRQCCGGGSDISDTEVASSDDVLDFVVLFGCGRWFGGNLGAGLVLELLFGGISRLS